MSAPNDKQRDAEQEWLGHADELDTHRLVEPYHGGANASAIADWLADLNSHDLYDPEMLAGDASKLGLTVDRDTWTVRDPRTGKEARLHVMTNAQVVASIKARGLGGWVNPDMDRLIAAFDMADTLCGLVTGQHSQAMGRGFRFNQSIDLLRKHAKEQS